MNANTRKCTAVLAVTLACAAYGVSAATPAKKPHPSPVAVWDKEPASFLGFEFGKPLPSDLVTCPSSLRDLALNFTHTPCLQVDEPIVKLWLAPELGFPYTNFEYLHDGNVASVTLQTSVDNYDALKSLLTTRYGPPTRTSTTVVKTMAGGEFSSEQCRWTGARISILLDQRHEKVDQSQVFVEDTALMRAVMDQAHAKQNEAASKL
ncbi:hypothetical protein [Paraburkholderia caffeinilytica]|nr:hypothetical protein [Paraburkholderia caffeinilytica]